MCKARLGTLCVVRKHCLLFRKLYTSEESTMDEYMEIGQNKWATFFTQIFNMVHIMYAQIKLLYLYNYLQWAELA